MRLFGKGERKLAEGQERFAQRVATKIIRLQRRVADQLNARTAGFSVQRWRVMLFAFCLLLGGYSLYLLLTAIY